MRNLAWSVFVLGLTGMTSTAAMAQVETSGTGLASAVVSPAALPALSASVVSDDGQATAPAPTPAQAAAPAPAPPPPKPLTLTAGADFPTAYMFRGIFQEDEGFIFQPWVDLGIALYSGEGQLKGVSANVGNWNSIHSGPSGSELYDNAWYEADFYGSVTFTFGKFKPGALFTSYTSPNNGFNTVHELAAVFAVDDSGNKVPLSPKVILAFELSGQADAGDNKGTYLELGIRPSIKLGKSPATLSIPVKLGLSLSDYYELPEGSDTFGYFDTGFIGGVGLPIKGKVTWEVHGGVDFLWFGNNLKLRNHDDSFKAVGTLGFSITY